MSRTIRGMSQAQSRVWLALVSIGQLLPSALDSQLTADAGLINFEYGILSALRLAEDQTMRSGDLATALGSPAPRMSKAISRLEKRGLVTRVPCASDGRARNVTLTQDGEELCRKASKPHVDFARDVVMGGVGDEELAALAELLRPILLNLDPEAVFEKAFARYDADGLDDD